MYNNINTPLNKVLMSMKITSLLTKTQNTILSAAFILAFASGINAILGFVKARLLAVHFGVSNSLAIFYTADKIPNLIYTVLIVGAISTVFIPVFTSLLNKDEKEAFKVASSIMIATFILFFILGALVFIFSEQIMATLAVGTFSQEEIRLGSNLIKIMIASQLFLIAGSLITSVLQSFKYFLIPAFAPIIYNVGIILGTIFLSGKIGIYGPAVGVSFGALFHFLIQTPLLKKIKFKFFLKLDFQNKSFKKMFGLVPPRIVGALTWNLIDTIQNSIALLISAQSAVYLKFAGQLQGFPVTLVGLSMAAAMLPTLSAQEKKDNMETFKQTFLTSFHQTMYLVMPISAILLILRVPAIRIVFGVSTFPWEATVKTAHTLAFFAISIFAQSAVYLFSRAFYALKDTVTPLITAVFTSLINILLSILFVLKLNLGVWSIAFGFSISSIINAALLLIVLNKKVGKFKFKNLFIPFAKIAWATAFMGIALWVPLRFLDEFVFDTTRTIYLLALTFVAGVSGITTYFFLTKWFKVSEVELFYKLIRKLKPKPSHITPQTLAHDKNGKSQFS
ncbi:murein biosynthesis integral membrane protein MurJ [Patescibacteria group bacterium]